MKQNNFKKLALMGIASSALLAMDSGYAGEASYSSYLAGGGCGGKSGCGGQTQGRPSSMQTGQPDSAPASSSTKSKDMAPQEEDSAEPSASGSDE